MTNNINNSPKIQKYIVEEEITVGIALVRPKEDFLNILRLAGAKVEVFTRQEICQYLKDYIGARKLYDPTDPRIVYCDNDPLETVFNVKQFTVDEVIGLINNNVTMVPDTCIKRMRQMVYRTLTSGADNTTTTTTQQVLTKPVCQTTDSINTTTPVITSTTSIPSQPTSDTQSESTDDSHTKNHRKRKHEGSGDEVTVRKRRTSLNVVFSDTDSVSYPWYFQVKMEDTGTDDNPIKDSSTDNNIWYVEEDTISVQYDTDAFTIEYDVESESSDITSTDISSIKSGKDIFVMCNDSDVEFWADSDGTDKESDPDIPDSDKWSCEECQERNCPKQAYCDKCWKMRPGWFCGKGGKDIKSPQKKYRRSYSAPIERSSSESSDNFHNVSKSSSSLQSSDNSPLRNNESRLTCSRPYKDDSGISLYSQSQSSQCSSQEKLCSSSQELSSSNIGMFRTLSNFQVVDAQKKCAVTENSENSIPSKSLESTSKFIDPQNITKSDSKQNDPEGKQTDSDLCVVCLSRPKTGSIIHGSTGHQVCCFKCAKQLKRKKKPCPVCRRPIQKVVRNYLL